MRGAVHPHFSRSLVTWRMTMPRNSLHYDFLAILPFRRRQPNHERLQGDPADTLFDLLQFEPQCVSDAAFSTRSASQTCSSWSLLQETMR
jgi:hypothetical protein